MHKIQNTGMALVNENLRAMKDGALIASGKGIFSVAQSNVPKEFQFLTNTAFGKIILVALMQGAVKIYDQPHLGCVVSAMAAHAGAEVLDLLGTKATEAYDTCGKLSAQVLPAEGRTVELRKQAAGENDKDTRFSTTIGTTAGKELPADSGNTDEYWPTKQSELIEQKDTKLPDHGKFKCAVCGKFHKRKTFGMTKFPVTHAGKPDVLACEACRSVGSKEVKTINEEIKKSEAANAAIAAVKVKEERFHTLKAEITDAQAKLTKAENSAKNFEKMLEAQPDDEAMIAGVDAANAKVIEMSDKLTVLEAEAEKLEQELGMSKDKSGKPGVIDKLRNK